MKTIAISLLSLLFSNNSTAQQNIYQQKMGEALIGFSTAQNTTDYTNLAAKFERISNVETS